MNNENNDDRTDLEHILNIGPTNSVVEKNDMHIECEYDDIASVKVNIKEVIMKGNDALDDLMVIARISEQPRAYEVLANLIRTLVDANKELATVNLNEKRIINNSVNDNRKMNNNFFVGSTSDLLKILKPHKVDEITIENEDEDE